MGIEEQQRRRHRNENSDEQNGDLRNRLPREVVRAAHTLLGCIERKQNYADQNDFAQELHIERSILAAHCGNMRFVHESHRRNDADDIEDVDCTRHGDAQRLVLLFVAIGCRSSRHRP